MKHSFKLTNESRMLIEIEFMRTIQFLGFISTLAGLISGYLLLAPVDSETTASAASGVGFGLMFIVAPLLGCSAFLLIPSSMALISTRVRNASYFTGKFWLGLWGTNTLISLSYIFVMGYLIYVYFMQIESI